MTTDLKDVGATSLAVSNVTSPALARGRSECSSPSARAKQGTARSASSSITSAFGAAREGDGESDIMDEDSTMADPDEDASIVHVAGDDHGLEGHSGAHAFGLICYGMYRMASGFVLGILFLLAATSLFVYRKASRFLRVAITAAATAARQNASRHDLSTDAPLGVKRGGKGKVSATKSAKLQRTKSAGGGASKSVGPRLEPIALASPYRRIPSVQPSFSPSGLSPIQLKGNPDDVEYAYGSFDSDADSAVGIRAAYSTFYESLGLRLQGVGGRVALLFWKNGRKLVFAGVLAGLVFTPGVFMHYMNLKQYEIENSAGNSVGVPTLPQNPKSGLARATLPAMDTVEALSDTQNNGGDAATYSQPPAMDVHTDLSEPRPEGKLGDEKIIGASNVRDTCGVLSIKQCALAVEQGICKALDGLIYDNCKLCGLCLSDGGTPLVLPTVDSLQHVLTREDIHPEADAEKLRSFFESIVGPLKDEEVRTSQLSDVRRIREDEDDGDYQEEPAEAKPSGRPDTRRDGDDFKSSLDREFEINLDDFFESNDSNTGDEPAERKASSDPRTVSEIEVEVPAKQNNYCEDDAVATSRCCRWAALGECDQAPAYMHTSCRRSCGLCPGDKGCIGIGNQIETELDSLRSSFHTEDVDTILSSVEGGSPPVNHLWSDNDQVLKTERLLDQTLSTLSGPFLMRNADTSQRPGLFDMDEEANSRIEQKLDSLRHYGAIQEQLHGTSKRLDTRLAELEGKSFRYPFFSGDIERDNTLDERVDTHSLDAMLDRLELHSTSTSSGEVVSPVHDALDMDSFAMGDHTGLEESKTELLLGSNERLVGVGSSNTGIGEDVAASRSYRSSWDRFNEHADVRMMDYEDSTDADDATESSGEVGDNDAGNEILLDYGSVDSSGEAGSVQQFDTLLDLLSAKTASVLSTAPDYASLDSRVRTGLHEDTSSVDAEMGALVQENLKDTVVVPTAAWPQDVEEHSHSMWDAGLASSDVEDSMNRFGEAYSTGSGNSVIAPELEEGAILALSRALPQDETQASQPVINASRAGSDLGGKVDRFDDDSNDFTGKPLKDFDYDLVLEAVSQDEDKTDLVEALQDNEVVASSSATESKDVDRDTDASEDSVWEFTSADFEDEASAGRAEGADDVVSRAMPLSIENSPLLDESDNTSVVTQTEPSGALLTDLTIESDTGAVSSQQADHVTQAEDGRIENVTPEAGLWTNLVEESSGIEADGLVGGYYESKASAPLISFNPSNDPTVPGSTQFSVEDDQSMTETRGASLLPNTLIQNHQEPTPQGFGLTVEPSHTDSLHSESSSTTIERVSISEEDLRNNEISRAKREASLRLQERMQYQSMLWNQLASQLLEGGAQEGSVATVSKSSLEGIANHSGKPLMKSAIGNTKLALQRKDSSSDGDSDAPTNSTFQKTATQVGWPVTFDCVSLNCSCSPTRQMVRVFSDAGVGCRRGKLRRSSTETPELNGKAFIGSRKALTLASRHGDRVRFNLF
eukprot:scaffold175_cov414-Prasinococcus_capsulatus_cf.AAC.23